MMLDYFIHNGKKHHTGTVILVKNPKYPDYPDTASFICYDVNNDRCIYKIGNCRYHHYEKDFKEILVAVTDEVDPNVRVPVRRKCSDWDIAGLPEAWVVYIIAMAVSTIFEGNIVFWAIWSLTFYLYRKNKIGNGGTYIEW